MENSGSEQNRPLSNDDSAARDTAPLTEAGAASEPAQEPTSPQSQPVATIRLSARPEKLGARPKIPTPVGPAAMAAPRAPKPALAAGPAGKAGAGKAGAGKGGAVRAGAGKGRVGNVGQIAAKTASGIKRGANAATRLGARGVAKGGPVAAALPRVFRAKIAGPAMVRYRHKRMMAIFGLAVALPSLVAAAYLWLVADDQYAANVAFSVRKEDFQSSMDLLGGITKMAGSSGSDTDILYEYILSQDIVAQVNQTIDIEGIWSKSWPGDPVFAYNPSGTIEDLTDHWTRKVSIAYDTGTGLIAIRVLAFTPEDAKLVAEAIYERSSALINDLSDAARADAIRYAQTELDRAVERLKGARQELTAFRIKTQIVDPQADLAGQMGVLNSLQSQLAEAQVEQDLLSESARADDPRVSQIGRRIIAIENRIRDERQKFGQTGAMTGTPIAEGEDYATMVAEFERLSVDLRFAEESYAAALAAYDSARAEAQKQSRYLAAYIRPSVAEQSLYPERLVLWGLSTFFLLMAWGVGALIYYSLRDRR